MADSRMLLVSNIEIMKAVWKNLKKVFLTISTFFQNEKFYCHLPLSVKPLHTCKNWGWLLLADVTE